MKDALTATPREKIAANYRVFSAIRAGELKRMPCEACGSQRVQAHHDDYEKPLEVRWLCPSCHKRHHIEQKRAAHPPVAQPARWEIRVTPELLRHIRAASGLANMKPNDWVIHGQFENLVAKGSGLIDAVVGVFLQMASKAEHHLFRNAGVGGELGTGIWPGSLATPKPNTDRRWVNTDVRRELRLGYSPSVQEVLEPVRE